MRSRTRLGYWVAVVVLFSLFAGEAIRNTLSWWGFAVWDGTLALAMAVVGVALWRETRREGAGGSGGRLRALLKRRGVGARPGGGQRGWVGRGLPLPTGWAASAPVPPRAPARRRAPGV